MPVHHEQRFAPYTPRQMFELVADVEKYPEFLPWCALARILKRQENRFEAELVIRYKQFSESYVSDVQLTPPGADGAAAIDVTQLRGPFMRLENHWKFLPQDGGTRIDFALDFQFRSKILQMMIGAFYSRAAEKMVAAFLERAERLYGGSDPIV
ncbi:MAG: type II toxin-antitoxin system RatA family toxin [Alphaproteobacteria bacterium]|nr:type II toxin-antitoxin system RatA family toxin [Alphaproteobacteria bacterium]